MPGGIKVGFPWTLGGVRMEAVLRFAWHDASILTMSHQCSENISVRDNESLFAFLDRLTEDQNRPVRLSVVDLRPGAVNGNEVSCGAYVLTAGATHKKCVERSCTRGVASVYGLSVVRIVVDIIRASSFAGPLRSHCNLVCR